jgi:hypothetical protein
MVAFLTAPPVPHVFLSLVQSSLISASGNKMPDMVVTPLPFRPLVSRLRRIMPSDFNLGSTTVWGVILPTAVLKTSYFDSFVCVPQGCRKL